jgi:PHD/YefM family antitoxin component YafN of YafNO toxin-antitoxin module
MNATQLLEKVQFVVDAKGQQSAVLLNMEDWEQLLILLEALEDAEEIRRLREEDKEEISWEQAKVELGLDI